MDAYSETYGEVSEIDDEDWDSDESETRFGDDFVPYAEDLQTKSEDVQRQESSSAASKH